MQNALSGADLPSGRQGVLRASEAWMQARGRRALTCTGDRRSSGARACPGWALSPAYSQLVLNQSGAGRDGAGPPFPPGAAPPRERALRATVAVAARSLEVGTSLI